MVKVYRIKDKGLLVRLKKNGEGECWTCHQPFKVGDEVVRPSKSSLTKARRHVECAKKVGIHTGA